ncbi:MAG: tetratricopeptide repeat protein [Candidatus Heimdallarchaeota archaeon]
MTSLQGEPENTLQRAEQLLNEGNYDEALQTVKTFENEGTIEPQDQIDVHLLKSRILTKQGAYEEALQLAKRACKASQDQGPSLQVVDAYIAIANILEYLGEFNESSVAITQGEEVLRALPQNEPETISQREAGLLYHRGVLYGRNGALDMALMLHHQSLELREKTGDKLDIASSFNSIGIIYRQKGDLNRALENYQQSLALRKEVGNKKESSASLNNIGIIFMEKGELNEAMEHFEQSLAILKELGNKLFIAMCLNNIANVHEHKGALDRALDYYQQSLTLKEELGNDWETAGVLFGVISLLLQPSTSDDRALNQGSMELAQQYFHRLQQIDSQEDNKVVSQLSRVAEALMLKTSPLARKRVRAEEILEQVAAEEVVNHELTVLALLNLCDLLLAELRLSNDPEMLAEVQSHAAKLLQIADQKNSHWLLAEAYVLKSKLALVEMDLRSAHRFLTQAQLIAEERGLRKLAMKISHDHDSLLQQATQWQEAISRNAPLAERLELANVEDLVEHMAYKRAANTPDQAPEESVMAIILAKSGLSLFSKTFIPESQINDQLLGGFLSAINSFGSEIFGMETIDRIMYQEHTLAVKAYENMMFSYIFRGPSYFALQKLEKFVKQVYESQSWEGLKFTMETGKTLKEPEAKAIAGFSNKIFLST